MSSPTTAPTQGATLSPGPEVTDSHEQLSSVNAPAGIESTEVDSTLAANADDTTVNFDPLDERERDAEDHITEVGTEGAGASADGAERVGADDRRAIVGRGAEREFGAEGVRPGAAGVQRTGSGFSVAGAYQPSSEAEAYGRAVVNGVPPTASIFERLRDLGRDSLNRVRRLFFGGAQGNANTMSPQSNSQRAKDIEGAIFGGSESKLEVRGNSGSDDPANPGGPRVQNANTMSSETNSGSAAPAEEAMFPQKPLRRI